MPELSEKRRKMGSTKAEMFACLLDMGFGNFEVERALQATNYKVLTKNISDFVIFSNCKRLTKRS